MQRKDGSNIAAKTICLKYMISLSKTVKKEYLSNRQGPCTKIDTPTKLTSGKYKHSSMSANRKAKT